MNNPEILDQENEDERQQIEGWKICLGSSFLILICVIVAFKEWIGFYIPAFIMVLLYLSFIYGYYRSIKGLKRDNMFKSILSVLGNTVLGFLDLILVQWIWTAAINH